MRKLALRVALFTLLVPASVGLASEGVLEINQACADNTGCFSGDAAGLPVMITAAGSYRLTSNLIVPNESTDGIKVNTSSVSIDLNGFEIVRSGCEGATTTCTPASGTGSGIERTANSNRGISVKNGSITGMGTYGVLVGSQAEVTNLRLRWNRLRGIYADSGSTVSGNTAYGNGDDGIYVGSGSTISGNTAYGNGDVGILSGSASTISGNTMYNNGGDGIDASFGSTVSGNTVSANSGDGIDAANGSTVFNNTVRNNTGYGLVLSPDSGYHGNVISNNAGGTVSGGINLGANACDATAACP